MKTQTTTGMAACMAAAVLVLPLSACGSSDEGESGGLSTAAEAAPADADVDASASEKSEKKDDKENKDDDKKQGNKGDNEKDNKSSSKKPEQQGGGNGGEEAPTLANPFENGMPENTNQPIEGGEEGSDEDARQMEETGRAVLNPESFSGWTRTILDNSCKAVAEPMMEELERQGLTLEQVEEAGRVAEQQGQALEIPQSEVSISDVRVDGNRASANLTAKNDSGEETHVMIFEKEDGRWKLCN